MRNGRTLAACVAALVVMGGLLFGTAAPALAASEQEPTPPSNLRVTDVGQFTVDLAWEPSSLGGPALPWDTPLYFVEDQSGKRWASFAKDATSGKVNGLTPGTTYTFRLGVSYGTPATSPRSNPVTFTTDSAEPLPVPSNLRVVENTSGTEVTVDFDVAADPRVSHYQVTDGAGREVRAGHFTGSSRTGFFVQNLRPETDYSFAVSAVMETSTSRYWVGGPSELISVRTSRDSQPPATPLGLRTAGQTATSVTLTWGVDDPTFPALDNVGVVEYLISNGETTKSLPYGSAVMWSVTFVFDGLRPETTYTFTVRARDEAGNVSAPASHTVTTRSP